MLCRSLFQDKPNRFGSKYLSESAILNVGFGECVTVPKLFRQVVALVYEQGGVEYLILRHASGFAAHVGFAG